MGSILYAKCSCGYYTQYTLGAGMLTFEEFFWVPALCKNCSELVNVNYYDKEVKCPNCKSGIVFYNDPRLQRISKSSTSSQYEEQYSWDEFDLPAANYYYCPRCKKKNMKFEQGILFD